MLDATPTLYSPAIRYDGDKVRISFAPGHPGADDPAYIAHRESIAALALKHSDQSKLPAPIVSYTEQEHATWKLIRARLAARHEECASAEILHGMHALDLPADHVPQLADVSNVIQGRTGFTFRPAAGLMPARDFYLSFGNDSFLATQYIRHHTQPFFSPEPDMVHEIVGHGSALANPRCADLYRNFGKAISRLRSDAAINLASRVFWFCIEYGVIHERGEIRAFGASLLSSSAELAGFRQAVVRSLDARVMAVFEYDVTRYQPVLFCADSFDQMEDFFLEFCRTIDDETPMQMGITL
jgi:phenylalanine-4-hydroxylase